jgi:DNA-binding NtrC family response regulator
MSAPAPQPAPEFRWQAFFQRSRDPLFLLNRQRRLLFVNAAWQELTGLPAAEARGRVCTRRAPASPSSWNDITRALCPPPEVLRGQSARVRRLLPAATGGHRCWDVEFLPFRGDEGALGILGKITPAVVDTATVPATLPEKVIALRAALVQRHSLDSVAGDAPAQQRLSEQVRLAAGTRATVLLTGEAGTGKQWLARVIHGQSPARERAFAALDCRRLPPKALAATLFDSGGLTRHPGVGTIYLREPAGLPRDLQDRLCEFLADPGPDGPRILAGSSVDLAEEVRAGRVLEALRCSLSTLVLELPALRQRLVDLPWLVERLLAQTTTGDERGPPRLTPAACDCLRTYHWPGNLRELGSVLASARLHAEGEAIDAVDLPGYLRLAAQLSQVPGSRNERTLPLAPLLEQVERRLIQLALHRTQGNKSRAAELLSLWRPRLLRRMEALGLIEKEG